MTPKRGSVRLPLAAGVLLMALTACEGAREAIGLQKQSPDEFAVVTRAPLSLPPDYGLRPPQPGERRPQEKEVKDSARNTLFRNGETRNQAAADLDVSRGEAALLASAGALRSDPSIRRKIDRESSILTEEEGFVDRLLFWQEKPPPGTVVDAELEARRLRENAALGDAPTKGRTPRIERKPKGWLEGIIN